MKLPPQARLTSHEMHVTDLRPGDYLPLLNVSGRGLLGGAVLLTSLSVRAPHKSFQFLEGCMRAGASATQREGPQSNQSKSLAAGEVAEEQADSPWLLSSGTEDYFLGTFYFDKGWVTMPPHARGRACWRASVRRSMWASVWRCREGEYTAST